MSNIEFTVGNRQYEGTPENTYLFTFAGELACYDHIFLIMEETEEGTLGRHMWSSHTDYPGLKTHMLGHGFPAHLNMPDIAEEDIAEFEDYHYREFRKKDIFPPNWVKE